MGQGLLVNEQIDAGEAFIRDFNEYVSVSVACWVSPTETSSVYLYVASDDIDDGNTGVAYGELRRRMSGKRSQWLDPFQIKLVNSSDPIARDAMQIRDRYPTNTPTRYPASSIGGMSIEGAFIYPPLAAMKSAP